MTLLEREVKRASRPVPRSDAIDIAISRAYYLPK